MKTLNHLLATIAGVTALSLAWLQSGGRVPNPFLAAASAAQPAAPELVGDAWLNTPGGKPITLAGRQGKVTVVEFWTFGCSNCQANLPSYARLFKKFEKQGVTVIGVHTPETGYERDPKNVAARVKELGITYPVLLDAENDNWNRWNQHYWPTLYIVDKTGHVRQNWIGELNSGGAGGEAKVSNWIQTLLDEPDAAPNVSTTNPSQQGKLMNKVVKTEAEWRSQLTPAQFDVLRQKGTERAFSGDYDNHQHGIYKCAGCGQELFSSDAKFDSGTGWPSFYQPISKEAVEEETDTKFFMRRTEILCSHCEGHLGHVFNDGPAPTGQRYCMNAVALKFEKTE